MARVLVADKLHSRVTQQLEALGCDVDAQPQLGTDQLPGAISDSDILIVRSTKVDESTLNAAANLSLIIRAGAGVNTIDVAKASDRGIHVVNCPGVNAAAVAELTAGLLIAADRRIADACADLRSGSWKKKMYSQAHGLKGRTLGILGMGAIGRAVAKIAQGMEMNVVGWSRSFTPEQAKRLGMAHAATAKEVAQQSDAVSVHLALAKETQHFIGSEFLNAMRDGSILVNTSRGPLVDTEALREAIDKKSLRVALDVFEEEPSGGDVPFNDTQLAKRITGTPHIGASTTQTSEAIGDAVVEHVRLFVKEGRVANSVNMGNRSPATHRIVIRHLNRVGVLASVLDGLRAENINVEEMENTIFDSAEAAICTLHIDSAPSEKLTASLSGQKDILQISQFRI
jgi:D-3-phosphoglycerate dehydrogenase